MSPRPVTLVRQRGRHDCGAACLAMVLRKDLDYVLGLLGRDVEAHNEEWGVDGGTITSEYTRILWEHGILHLWWYSDEVFSRPNPQCGFHHSPWRWALRDQYRVATAGTVNDHLAAGGTAILNVRFGDNEELDNGHAIVVSDHAVFDPAPEGREVVRLNGDGTRMVIPSGWEIDEAVLIREFPLAGP